MTTQAKQELKSIRADHTGALRRPEWLRELSYQYGEGKLGESEFRDAQDKAVREAVALQESLGFPVVSDGELRRQGFQASFGEAVTGFNATPRTYERPHSVRDPNQAPRRVESGLSGPGPAILNRLPTIERLKMAKNMILDEYKGAAVFTSAPVKVTIVGPDRIQQRFEWENSKDVYPGGLDEFVADVVSIQRQMISEVVAAGCRYVQIDEPGYTAYVDEPSLAKMRARGEDIESNIARGIAADNAVIADFPGVTFGVHVCRGGGGGRGGPGWHREGAYDAIAERLFGQLNFDRFLLEYDGEHAGGLESIRYLTGDKVAVLGLVSNHGELEAPEYVKGRIEEASKYLPLERLALCPRCGLGGSPSEDMMKGKLGLVRQVAQDVWG